MLKSSSHRVTAAVMCAHVPGICELGGTRIPRARCLLQSHGWYMPRVSVGTPTAQPVSLTPFSSPGCDSLLSAPLPVVRSGQTHDQVLRLRKSTTNFEGGGDSSGWHRELEAGLELECRTPEAQINALWKGQFFPWCKIIVRICEILDTVCRDGLRESL
jgi:hypothetical protein